MACERLFVIGRLLKMTPNSRGFNHTLIWMLMWRDRADVIELTGRKVGRLSSIWQGPLESLKVEKFLPLESELQYKRRRDEAAGENRDAKQEDSTPLLLAGFEDKEWRKPVEAENNWSTASEETGVVQSPPTPQLSSASHLGELAKWILSPSPKGVPTCLQFDFCLLDAEQRGQPHPHNFWLPELWDTKCALF